MSLRVKFVIFSVCLLLAALVFTPIPTAAQTAAGPVVRAVLFYSPTCGHCQYVITEVLLPMLDTYSDQLVILGVDVSQPGGGQLYGMAMDFFEIPDDQRGVPVLIIEDTLLQGSGEIPEKFPGLVTAALASDGTGWPTFPGMQEALPPEEPGATEPAPGGESEGSSSVPTLTPVSPTAVTAATDVPAAPPALIPTQPSSAGGPTDIREGVSEAPPDPLGFTLGGMVLIGLVGSFGAATRWLGQSRRRLPDLRLPLEVLTGYAQSIWILVLSLAGLGVSGYLAYVEVNQVEAVCGPIGACNIVQSSAYAQILGIPIAVFGLAFYLATIALWLTLRSGLALPSRQLAALGLLALALTGTLFSIYLTGLELFVIHAVCLWCLSSAVLTASLLVVLGWPLQRLGKRG